MTMTPGRARDTRPTTADALHDWVRAYTGVRIPRASVCAGHAAPFDLFARQVLERPSLALWHGPRGSGKSFLSAIDTHLASRFNPRHGTRILGGSLSQSRADLSGALRRWSSTAAACLGGDAATLESLLKTEARYRNGSTIAILAASPTSVRGPHVAEPQARRGRRDRAGDPRGGDGHGDGEARLHGQRAHDLDLAPRRRPDGRADRARPRRRVPGRHLLRVRGAGAMPGGAERGQPGECPECPLVRWCHADRDQHPIGPAQGQAIERPLHDRRLIQKVKAVCARVFESDYLCLGPKAAGVWFTMFDEQVHVTPTPSIIRDLAVHVAVDSGVHTGAVWFQVRPRSTAAATAVNVFADYFAEGVSAEANAAAIRRQSETLLRDRPGTGPGCRPTRPARRGPRSARPSAANTSVPGSRGCNGLESWPGGKKADGLQLVEALLQIGRRHGQPHDPSAVPALDPGLAVLRHGPSGRRSGWITPKTRSTHMRT